MNNFDDQNAPAHEVHLKSADKSKQLWYDYLNGGFYLVDSKKGTQIKCDKKGNRAQTFHVYNSGTMSYKDRVKLAQVKKDDSILPRVAKTVLEDPKVGYRPIPRNFNGYTHFPRPAGRAYSNEAGRFKQQLKKIPKIATPDCFTSPKNINNLFPDTQSAMRATCTFLSPKYSLNRFLKDNKKNKRLVQTFSITPTTYSLSHKLKNERTQKDLVSTLLMEKKNQRRQKYVYQESSTAFV